MILVPQLLIENGNYTSLADLTLRKIKALDELNLNPKERDRVMTEEALKNERNHCY